MINADKPILTASEDKLNRAPLAQGISEMILNLKSSDSVVMGIESAWGTGKTSFTNMILENLKSKVHPLKFNPWNFSDENSLLADFFNAFANLPPVREKENLRKSIKKYSNKLSKMGTLSLNLYFIKYQLNQVFGDEPLSKVKNALDKSLGELDKKVVVVIDDIDRLDDIETKSIFKLVKITANFPNTIFILCYDRDRVVKILSEDGSTLSGNEYLKKIIQVSFILPEAEKQDIYQILLGDIDVAMFDIYGDLELDQSYWELIFHRGFKNLFKSIRDIKSYINSLKLDWSLISKEDINRVDFIAVVAIRVFAHKFYVAMRNHKHLFTGVPDSDSLFNTDKGMMEKTYLKLLEDVPEEIREDIGKICKQIFPPIQFGTGYSFNIRVEWRKKLRICSSDKFNFYFKMAVPKDAVTEADILKTLVALNDIESFVTILKELDNGNRLKIFLQQLLDYIDDLKENEIKVLILGSWELSDWVDATKYGYSSLESIETLVINITFKSIANNISENRDSFITKLVKESKVLYPAINFVESLLQHAKDGPQSTGVDLLLNEEEFQQVQKVTLQKLKDASEDETLRKHPNLLALLFWWRSLGGKTAVSDFISKLMGNNTDVANLLASAVTTVYSFQVNGLSSTQRKLNKDSFDTLIPIEKVENAVAEIPDNDLEAMDERQQEAIQLFRAT